MIKAYTPEVITSLEPNEVFVYGSNEFAFHGGGAAKKAIEFGATYGDTPIGLVGQTYGIITVSCNSAVIELDFISSQVKVLFQFARLRPELTFYVTKIGCGIAGIPVNEVACIFFNLEEFRPKNVILPIEFSTIKN